MIDLVQKDQAISFEFVTQLHGVKVLIGWTERSFHFGIKKSPKT